MFSFLPNIKNYIIYLLLGLLIISGIDVYIKSGRIAKADKTIKEQETAIVAKDSAIAGYKRNIQLAKEHEARVVVIEQKSAVVQKKIEQIKNTRDLSNEENIPAIDITAMFNGVQSSDSKTGSSRKVLSGGDQTDAGKSKDGEGTSE